MRPSDGGGVKLELELNSDGVDLQKRFARAGEVRHVTRHVTRRPARQDRESSRCDALFAFVSRFVSCVVRGYSSSLLQLRSFEPHI